MLPPFGQDVASVAPFSGRLASLPLWQAVTTNRKDLKLSFNEGQNPFRFHGERNSGLAISSSDVLSGPGGHQGYRICAGAVGRLQPLAWHLSVTHSLVNICMPQS